MNREENSRRLRVAFQVALFLPPLLLALTWDPHLPSSAYAFLAALRGGAVEGSAAVAQAPLYALVVALLARGGPAPHLVAPALDALGWGVAALAVYHVGRQTPPPESAPLRGTLGGALAALLTSTAPAFVATLGTGVPWAVAAFWVAVTAHLRYRRRRHDVALFLMLGARLSPLTLAAAALLVTLRWRSRRKMPVAASLIALMGALALAFSAWRLGPAELAPPGVGATLHAARRLETESEFYWLALPLVAAGLLALRGRRTGWVAVLYWPVTSPSGDAVALAGTATALSFLVGTGIEGVLQEARKRERLPADARLVVGLALLALLPAALAQASSLAERHALRPTAHHALEAQAGAWLRAHAPPDATLLASPHVAYHVGRPTLLWEGDSALALGAWPDPDYAVSSRTLAWDELRRTFDFRTAYVPVQTFSSPYASTSPVTVWRRHSRPVLPVAHHPLDVLLPEHAFWVGYAYAPAQLEPGVPLSVTLYLHLPVGEAEVYRGSYRTRVQLVPPGGGDPIVGPVTGETVEVSTGVTGPLVAERFVLHPSPDLPVGAYRLEARVTTYHADVNLHLYAGDEPYPQETAFLDYVAVPWQGSLAGAELSGAHLGDAARLVAYQTPQALVPGEVTEVRLYWEALRPLDENYTVFVHLVDGQGNWIAGHDAPPLLGRYPTYTWEPGTTVPDPHPLTVPPELPPGTYRLQAGMYAWPGLERLPALLPDGTPDPEGAVVLTSFEVVAGNR